MENIADKNIKSNLSGRTVSNYLTFTEKKALTELKEKIKEKYPEAEIILYGSKARGDYDENSDIDLMIIIKDNYQINKGISFEELEKLYFLPVNEKIENEILSIVTDIQVKYCVSIDYQVKNKSYVETNLAGIVPLYQNIRKEGVEL
ncbi:MAG: nucleotidyltransferase domain-containing protein [Deltaproteobacteria bacterium]|jgi:predicted nucleotidyltransferase|nr:nucleotidyltransferase domain-containing protein [Deltaproteobacteria bacterium]